MPKKIQGRAPSRKGNKGGPSNRSESKSRREVMIKGKRNKPPKKQSLLQKSFITEIMGKRVGTTTITKRPKAKKAVKRSRRK